LIAAAETKGEFVMVRIAGMLLAVLFVACRRPRRTFRGGEDEARIEALIRLERHPEVASAPTPSAPAAEPAAAPNQPPSPASPASVRADSATSRREPPAPVAAAAVAALDEPDEPGAASRMSSGTSVNLADDEAWFVAVYWYPDGFVAESDFGSQPPATLLGEAQRATQALSDDEDYRLVRYAEDPELDTGRHLVTWVEETAEGRAAHRLECHAAKLGRRGAVEYIISDVAKAHQELCLRSVRLAAARTAFADGETYEDHSRLFDHKARYNLAGLVTGTALLAK
jgi:hypothetical protein